MGYGAIIKRAWKITWRYRALWVLGLFAGVTGSSGGGGGNYNFNSLGSNSGSKSNPFSSMDGAAFLRAIERLLPLIIVVTLGLIVIGIVWWILSVAARGGLVFAVNEIEDGRTMTLGGAWNAGFARFWSIFGLSILLALPVFALLLVMLFLTFVPVLVPLSRGVDPSPALLVPVCGTLAIGVPVLLVLSIILGLLHELALRYVMISGSGAVQAVGESWRAFRGRFKDTSLMWLIGLGLNLAAGFVLAIPLVILTLLVVVPAVVAGIAGQWAALAAVLLVAVLVITVISLAFTAIWGTFSSALWTVFFRRLTGMGVEPAPAQPAVAPGAYFAPPPPAPTAPPVLGPTP